MNLLSLRSRHVLALLLLCAMAVSACKKEKGIEKEIEKEIIYDFTISGSPYEGSSIHFYAASGSKWQWSLGDSTISNNRTADHTFPEAGTWSISLVINGDEAHKVTKSLKIGRSVTPAALAGARTYSHEINTYSMTDTGILVHNYPYPDTVIYTSIIDAATITFGYNALVHVDVTNMVDSFYFKEEISYGTYNAIIYDSKTTKILYYERERQGNNAYKMNSFSSK